MAQPASAAPLSKRMQAVLYYQRKRKRAKREAGRPVVDPEAPPTIDGVAEVGEELTALPGDWEGDPAFTYTWRSGTDIVGRQETYTLTEDDEGNLVTVTVEGHNRWGVRGATSAGVGPVTAP